MAVMFDSSYINSLTFKFQGQYIDAVCSRCVDSAVYSSSARDRFYPRTSRRKLYICSTV
jgi:hypothetical protein